MRDETGISGGIMPEIPRLTPKNGLWRYAVVGGLASLPLSIVYHWWSGMGNHFSTLPILLGGLLAGSLAHTNSRKPAKAGIGAGIIGGVPAYVFILPPMARTATEVATAWSSPLGAVVVVAFSAPAIVVIAALPGWIGGFVGGWLAEKVGGKQVAPVGG
jgi:hypothetical protein